MLLNLGCGGDIKAGWLNVDIANGPGVDVVHDLDTALWPWDAESVNGIRAMDVFEHLHKPLVFMTECWRVLVPGGQLAIRTTHWQSENAFTDPTHVRFPTEHTFDYWIAGTELYNRHSAAYGGAAFTLDSYHREGQEQVFLLRRLP